MAVTSHRQDSHVKLSDELLSQVDARVGRRRRDEFVQEAVEEKLRHLRLAEAFQRVVGSVADGDVPEWETPESTADWLRSLREDR